jgi:hypothetical protein
LASAAITASALKLVAATDVKPTPTARAKVKCAMRAPASRVLTARVRAMQIVRRVRVAFYKTKTARVSAAPCVNQATNALTMSPVSRLRFASPISATRRTNHVMHMVPETVCA